MAAIGGSIESVSINGREFAVTADADVSRKLGGTENEVMPNGNYTSRIIKTIVNWNLSGLVIQVDDSMGDQEFLQSVANGYEYVPIAITFASGITFQGDGIVAAELVSTNQGASATLDLQGAGSLTPQG